MHLETFAAGNYNNERIKPNSYEDKEGMKEPHPNKTKQQKAILRSPFEHPGGTIIKSKS